MFVGQSDATWQFKSRTVPLGSGAAIVLDGMVDVWKVVGGTVVCGSRIVVAGLTSKVQAPPVSKGSCRFPIRNGALGGLKSNC